MEMRVNGSKIDIVVRIYRAGLAADIEKRQVRDVFLQLDDGRILSIEQRKKIYATLRDIWLYTRRNERSYEVCTYHKDGLRLLFAFRLLHERRKGFYQYTYRFLP